MLQLEKKSYFKKVYRELVYEKCQNLFIFLQLNSCSFNLVNPGKKPRFHEVFAGAGVGVRKYGRGLPRTGPGRSISLVDETLLYTGLCICSRIVIRRIK